MKNLKFVLVFASSLLGHLLWGQCQSVETRVNGEFEEQWLLFKDDVTGKVLEEIDLVAGNPYNKLPFIVVEKDETYQMNIYEINLVNFEKIKDYFYLDEEFMPTSSLRINSQVDVVVDEFCNSTVVYGAYLFDENGLDLSFTSTVIVYDNQGNIYSAIRNRKLGDIFPVITSDRRYMVSKSMTLSQEGTSGGELRFTDLLSKKIVYEAQNCENEIWDLPARVRNTNLLFSTRRLKKSVDSSSERGTMYFVADLEKNELYVNYIDEKTMNSCVGIYPDGLRFSSNKKDWSITFKNDFKRINLNK